MLAWSSRKREKEKEKEKEKKKKREERKRSRALLRRNDSTLAGHRRGSSIRAGSRAAQGRKSPIAR